MITWMLAHLLYPCDVDLPEPSEAHLVATGGD